MKTPAEVMIALEKKENVSNIEFIVWAQFIGRHFGEGMRTGMKKQYLTRAEAEAALDQLVKAIWPAIKEAIILGMITDGK